MKIEKAIEILKEQKLFTPLGQACMEAIGALEKQIARKVVNKCSTFTMAECPHCNGTVNFPNKHCHWCGQKLDWSD